MDRMQFRVFPLTILFALVLPLTGQVETTGLPAEELPPPRLTYTHALILGVVEGITEYLPVSSTGHLILTNRLLHLDRDVPVYAPDGAPLWKVPPDPTASPAQPGEVYRFRDAVNAYTIVIQGGAIAAVALLYRLRLLLVLRGLVGRSRDGLMLGRNLLLSFLPAVVLGLLLEGWIDAFLFGPLPVIAALIAGSFLMLAVEAWRRRKLASAPSPSSPDLHELSPTHALAIGFLQCVAMWPGTSRSMMTIVGGYLVGLSPPRAAEYSFLLGFITLSAAAAYKAIKEGPVMLRALETGPVLVGCLVAFVCAALAIRWLISYLSRHGLALFAWYRLALALVVSLLIFG